MNNNETNKDKEIEILDLIWRVLYDFFLQIVWNNLVHSFKTVEKEDNINQTNQWIRSNKLKLYRRVNRVHGIVNDKNWMGFTVHHNFYRKFYMWCVSHFVLTGIHKEQPFASKCSNRDFETVHNIDHNTIEVLHKSHSVVVNKYVDQLDEVVN